MKYLKIFKLRQTIHLCIISSELALLGFNVYPYAVTADLSELYYVASNASKCIHYIHRFKA